MIIGKLYRQHNAVVMTVPVLVREALDAKAGDYVGLDIDELDHEVTMFKIHGRIGDVRKNEDGKSEHDSGGKA